MSRGVNHFKRRRTNGQFHPVGQVPVGQQFEIDLVPQHYIVEVQQDRGTEDVRQRSSGVDTVIVTMGQ